MLTLTITILALLHRTVAAPHITLTTKFPSNPPSETLPSICGVLSNWPSCPSGYQCQPFVTRFCTELEPDELCGFCSPKSPKTSSASKSTSVIPTTPKTTCPSGYTPDYRNWCRPNSQVTSSKSVFTCPEGFTPDYRGISYCRPTFPTTSTTSSSKSHSSITSPISETWKITCPFGQVTDYRGRCTRESTISPSVTYTRYVVEKREITTEVIKLDCDTRQKPDCPEDLRCTEIKKCPPFIAFCPGTCVGSPRTKVPTFIVDPPPPTSKM